VKAYYVYAILCFDGSFYVGITNDVARRFCEHENGLHESAYTHDRRPLKLVFATEFSRPDDAIAFEKKFKGWSHRKKRAFIDGDYDAMRRYGRGKDRPHPQRC